MCVSGELLNWFCWLDLLNSQQRRRFSRFSAETWMDFLMDFYSRNRCVAKADRGVPSGDVFIKPPIDPGCFLPPVLKNGLLFKKRIALPLTPPRQQTLKAAVNFFFTPSDSFAPCSLSALVFHSTLFCFSLLHQLLLDIFPCFSTSLFFLPSLFF